ncbi:MAG TPA: NnrS family protein [Gammaproteobacteria bacterium]|nr:NnrS family protein [Gammaproteobacteria bacterium]
MDPKSRWHVFTAAPHRMMMFGGAVQLVLVLLFWGGELAGRYTGLWAPLETVVPTTFAHGFLMFYTLFPFFLFGFLMTTYPRWMNGTIIPARRYITAFLLLAGGTLLFYVGLFVHTALVAVALLLILAGYSTALFALWQVYRNAPARSKFHESILNGTLAAAWLGVLSYLLWLWTANWTLLDFALTAGLWWFMLPLALTVCHRMIPFFSGAVLPDYQPYQPRWSLSAMVACAAGHGLLELAGLQAWLWLVDLPLALLALHHTRRWGFWRSFQVRLLSILHVAFLWVTIGMGLYTLQSLDLLLTGTAMFGRGPLHALTIGFLTSLTLAMATRVTLGHSGRPLQADVLTGVLFWGVGLVAVFRVLSEWPGLGFTPASHLNLTAAVVWLVAIGAWSLRFGPIYLRPRADGAPG